MLVHAFRFRPDVTRMLAQCIASCEVLRQFLGTDIVDDFDLKDIMSDTEAFIGRHPSQFVMDLLEQYYKTYRAALDADDEYVRLFHVFRDAAKAVSVFVRERIRDGPPDESVVYYDPTRNMPNIDDDFRFQHH